MDQREFAQRMVQEETHWSTGQHEGQQSQKTADGQDPMTEEPFQKPLEQDQKYKGSRRAIQTKIRWTLLLLFSVMYWLGIALSGFFARNPLLFIGVYLFAVSVMDIVLRLAMFAADQSDDDNDIDILEDPGCRDIPGNIFHDR